MGNYNTLSVSILGMAWDYFVTFKDGAQSSKEMHVMNVYNDPEFIQAVDSLPKADKNPLSGAKSVEAIASKFCLHYKDMAHYLFGLHNVLPVARDLPFDIDWDDDDNCKVNFNSDITKEDFMQIWKIVYRHKRAKHGGQISKNRLPDDGKLIYAIFKERQKKPRPTFKAIFSQYQKGELPYYKESTTNWFESEDALERYYNRHKPTE